VNEDKASKLEVVLAGAIFIVMIAFILYGFLGLKIGRIDNCWDNYTTEEQAIINCEGVNK
jgi:ABC-type proline/glycine betaine transport system permease subunit